jgi:hypothetical protein
MHSNAIEISIITPENRSGRGGSHRPNQRQFSSEIAQIEPQDHFNQQKRKFGELIDQDQEGAMKCYR